MFSCDTAVPDMETHSNVTVTRIFYTGMGISREFQEKQHSAARAIFTRFVDLDPINSVSMVIRTA